MARPKSNIPSKALLKRLADEINGIAPKPKKPKKTKEEPYREDGIFEWMTVRWTEKEMMAALNPDVNESKDLEDDLEMPF